MNEDLIIKFAKKVGLPHWYQTKEIVNMKLMQEFAKLVAEHERNECAKLVESITLEWPYQPEFAQVERATIQDCAKIIRQRAVTYD